MPNGLVFPVGTFPPTNSQVPQGMTDSEYMYELARACTQNSNIPEFVAHANRLTAIRHKIEHMERTHFNPPLRMPQSYGPYK